MNTTPAAELLERINKHALHLADRLSAGASEELLSYLKFSGSFHRYSANNQVLIWLQAPTVRFVAGFHDWKRKGRSVRKGAKALKVLAPIVRKLEGEGGEPVRGVVGFRYANVFADFDTEGEPLPDDGFMVVREGGSFDLLHHLAQRCPVPVEWTPCGRAHGMTDGEVILLDPARCAEQPAHAVRVFFHEWAHVCLHFEDRRGGLAREVRELEADASAYVLCALHGIEATAQVADYITTWGGQPDALRSSLERIARAVQAVMRALTPAEPAPELAA